MSEKHPDKTGIDKTGFKNLPVNVSFETLPAKLKQGIECKKLSSKIKSLYNIITGSPAFPVPVQWLQTRL